jgi:hypothetical protein
MATKTAHRSTSTDLGRLWAEAIRDYNARTGENLSAMRARSVAEVMEQTNAEMEQFKGFRDDGSKKSSFRSAMADHLGDLQTCIDGFAAVGAAAGAFPPAMPVGLVFTAAGRLLSVSRSHPPRRFTKLSRPLQGSEQIMTVLRSSLHIQLGSFNGSLFLRTEHSPVRSQSLLLEYSRCSFQYVAG